MAEKEIRNFALRDKDGNEIGGIHGKAAQAGGSKSCKSWSYRHQAERAWNQESTHIHRRAQAGKEAQRRTGLDACQDLEAAGQEGGRGEAGIALKPCF